jgi:hypothetical protein
MIHASILQLSHNQQFHSILSKHQGVFLFCFVFPPKSKAKSWMSDPIIFAAKQSPAMNLEPFLLLFAAFKREIRASGRAETKKWPI